MGLISDVGEVSLDSFLPDGFIKDLPIVGPAFSIVKISKDIRDRIFVEKMKSFIEHIDKNQKWREKFHDEEECKKISKQLLYIVDSCDDDEKLKLIGVAFNHFVKEEISKEEYFFTVNIISKSFYSFLKILLKIDEDNVRFVNDDTKYDYVGIKHLLNIGALDFDGQVSAGFDSQTGKMKSHPFEIVTLNEYGKFLRDLLIEMNKL